MMTSTCKKKNQLPSQIHIDKKVQVDKVFELFKKYTLNFLKIPLSGIPQVNYIILFNN